ncbi:MAG: hypothetical protein HYX43_04085 [Burkholderiales bacterium]|nr:hypothetical protein [Burkholderiales bacterium]
MKGRAVLKSGSTPRKPGHRISVLIFLTCGIWLIGLGMYFALLRPPLLPEDPRFIGSSLAQIQSTLPGLARWLGHVFVVAIDSNFKWVLLVPAVLWLAGIASYVFERRA